MYRSLPSRNLRLELTDQLAYLTERELMVYLAGAGGILYALALRPRRTTRSFSLLSLYRYVLPRQERREHNGGSIFIKNSFESVRRRSFTFVIVALDGLCSCRDSTSVTRP